MWVAPTGTQLFCTTDGYSARLPLDEDDGTHTELIDVQHESVPRLAVPVYEGKWVSR